MPFPHKLISLRRILLALYRRHGAYTLYLTSFLLTVVACLSLGILALFSIFSGPFQELLGYSQSVINTIIICQTIGMNISTPLSGYIADAKGTWILSVIAFVGYTLGFNLVLLILKIGLEHRFMYFAFFLIGCANAALLFSCLLNSAKSLGRYYKTLSISMPNMMVAFSSFLQIQAINLFFHDTQHPMQNFENIVQFFLYTLGASSLLSLAACRLTDGTETCEEEVDHSHHEEFHSFDASPLLSGAGVVIHSPSGAIIGSPHSWYVDDPASLLNIDDELSMLSESTSRYNAANVEGLTAEDITSSSLNYDQKMKLFFRDPLMYPLINCCMMSIGTTEFFIANLGSVLKNMNSNTLKDSLQVFSVASTLTRFSIMVLTDFLCTNFHLSRLTLFTVVVMLCGCSHLYLSTAPISGMHFETVVSLNAMLNSAVFTLVPAILASIYGLDILGTTWGVFNSSSIFGNLFLNVLYSFDFSENCDKTSDKLVLCTTMTFFVSGVVLVVCGAVVMYLKNRYINRALEFF